MGEAQPHQPNLGKTLGVVPEDAAVIGVVQGQRRDPVLPSRAGEAFPARIDRRVGETVRRVDVYGARTGAGHHRFSIADDLAAADVLGVDRHVHQAVGADTVALGAPRGAGDGGCVLCAGPGVGQAVYGEGINLIEGQGHIHGLGLRRRGQSLSLVPAPAPPSREASLSGT
ncbi:MAG: Uncharacterised protein [Rhodospirillaceae bacterium]|nr:MAG: Uncharacterised protein [Rhodospirillaceae bacterium]